MPLRYGGRCRPNNLREGAMVPLLRTFLREIKPRLAPTENPGGLFLRHSFSGSLAGAEATLNIRDIRKGRMP